MNFHIEDEAVDDSTHVIELGGEVDLYTAPEFKERMVELIESGKKQIVVDITKIFEITGLDRVFPIHSSREEALDAVSSGATD